MIRSPDAAANGPVPAQEVQREVWVVLSCAGIPHTAPTVDTSWRPDCTSYLCHSTFAHTELPARLDVDGGQPESRIPVVALSRLPRRRPTSNANLQVRGFQRIGQRNLG